MNLHDQQRLPFGDDVDQALEYLGQMNVLMHCARIYDQRSAAYGQVWRQHGALSNLLSAARKIDRLMEVWYHSPDGAKALHKDALDDAYDAINYLAFFIRNAQAGNLTGYRPERPDGQG